jgi:predicted ATPase
VIAVSHSGARRLIDRALRSAPMLVVIDNAEQVTEAIRETVPMLLAVDHTRLVITSRRPLGLSGERVHQLHVLDHESAVQLLRDRVSEVTTVGIELLADDVADAICGAVDGIPLAVELIAARLGALSAGDLAERLSDLPSLLGGGSQGGRHSSLGATVDGSYDVLTDDQQRLFRFSSIMVSGFDLQSVASCLQSLFANAETDVLLGELVRWSLVRFDGRRYQMLEPIRQYAAELLDRTGETSVASDLLIRWAVEFTQITFDNFTVDPFVVHQRLRAEDGNIEAALDAALDRGATAEALHMVGNVGYYWATTAALTGLHRAQQVLAACDGSEPTEARAWGLWGAGCIAQYTRDDALSESLLNQSLTLFAASDNQFGTLVVSYWLGRLSGQLDATIALASRLGNSLIHGVALSSKAAWLRDAGEPFGTYARFLDESEEIGRVAGLDTVRSGALILKALGMQLENFELHGNYSHDLVRYIADEAEAITRVVSPQRQLCNVIQIQVRVCIGDGRIDNAVAYVVEGLETAARTDQRALIAEMILNAAAVLHADGRMDHVSDLVDAAAPIIPLRLATFILSGGQRNGKRGTILGWGPDDIAQIARRELDIDELIDIAEWAARLLRASR